MKTVLVYGAILGAVVTGWMLVMGLTGWYRDPLLARLAFVAVPLEVGLIVGMLSRTSAAGRGYLGQVGAGALASLIGAALVASGSLLLGTLVFPLHAPELRAAAEDSLRARGVAEADIATQAAAQTRGQTPLGRATSGAGGTLVLGLVTTLLAGTFIRAGAGGTSDDQRVPRA